MAESNPVIKTLGGEASLSDLKSVSEVLMGDKKPNKYNLALIKTRNYTRLGEKQFTFANGPGVANLLEKVLEGTLSEKRVLSDIAVVFESVDAKTYFDHKVFSKKIKKHLAGREKRGDD
jgi:hypothetical protein